MSCKNKCCWLPHNWFCLKGLYWIFIALFYILLIGTLYGIYQLIATPMLSGAAFWQELLRFLLSDLYYMLLLLTVAAVLKSLRKIVHAVAPCCCEEKAEGKEEVVVTTTQEEKK